MSSAQKSFQSTINNLMQTPSVALYPYQHYSVSGEDATAFLQGQLTLDVQKIDNNTCLPAGYCNHKAQLFGILWLYRLNDQLYFFLHNDVAEQVLKRLNMFVLRSDLTFTSVDKQTYLITPAQAKTLTDQLPQQHGESCLLENNAKLIRIGRNTHFYLIIDSSSIDLAEVQPADAIALKTSTGVLDIHTETYEKLLPFQCGIGNLGGISYDKGCYVGQEVIAINKYRGKNNKYLAMGILAKPVDLGEFTLNEMIRSDAGLALGILTGMAICDDHSFLQVVMSERNFGQTVQLKGKDIVFTPIFAHDK